MKRSNSLLLAILAAVLALGAASALLPRRAGSRASLLRLEPRPAVAELEPLVQVGQRMETEVGVRAAHAGGFYSLPEGRSFELHFTSSSAADVRQAGASSGAQVEIELEGTMSVLVLQATESELVLRSGLHLIRVRASTSAGQAPADYQEALGEEFARPALVRMDRSGRILGYAFDTAARSETRNLVRTLWCAVRFAIDQDQGKWLVDEADSSGPCLIEYEWTDAANARATERRIVKTKLAYPGLASAPRITTSRGEGRMSLDLRWPLEGRYAERVELPLDDAGTSVRVETELSFALQRSGLVERVSLPRVDPLLAWESAAGGAEETRSPGLPSNLALAAETTSLEGILSTIEAQLAADLLESSELHDSQRILAELIRRDAQNLERLHALLPGLSLETSMVVLAAVGLAQTTEAQAYLAGILSDGDESEDLRLFANLAAHQIERPSHELLEALSSVILGPETPRNVHSSALLALGTLASRAVLEQGELALSLLLEHPGLEAGSDDLVIWLEALGNSGSARILQAVVEHLGHRDERVRVSAVSALRFLEPGESTALLIAALLDSSVRVRTTAAEELAAQSSPEAGRAVERFLAAESSVPARKRAVAAFGQRQPLDEDARVILMRVSATDSDATIRQLALQLLRQG